MTSVKITVPQPPLVGSADAIAAHVPTRAKGSDYAHVRCDPRCTCYPELTPWEYVTNAQRVFSDPTEPMTPETVASFRERGLEHLLVPHVSSVYRVGIDEPREGPYTFVPASIPEIAAIEDPVDRALAIELNDVWGLCPVTRALILSVNDAGVIGAFAQLRLNPPDRIVWQFCPETGELIVGPK